MSAPQSVVEAVAQAMYEGTEGHEYLWRSYASSYWDVWVEAAQPVADVAWQASLNALDTVGPNRYCKPVQGEALTQGA